ncbi:GIY-YIG nuclease family protein [Methylobacterium radiodurans]|uniref:Bacteriophage T5 Orf172 DNA-binding domain-containing protein n=1 Tax=Methylobacterium radiodurans TaxID=2202828 RepID=A0A2U8VPZ8_9HYPH|nr:GIY-YIG nuclease family protein [Methylobacterium radiodurans]AWN35707.1 hypothetical protein DK427_08080 [Methylobacterium radiodurans]
MRETLNLEWRQRKAGVVAYWVCPRAKAAQGFTPRTVQLWSGLDKASADLETIRTRCLVLQAELLDWMKRRESRRGLGSKRLGIIYFIRSADLVKIGFTNNLKRRLEAFTTATPQGYEVIGHVSGTALDERLWHARFKKLRVRGEWFRYTDGLAAAIQSAA